MFVVCYPGVRLGDRLFFETRFAQFLFNHNAGRINEPLAVGDPLVRDVFLAPGKSLPWPFQGQSIS